VPEPAGAHRLHQLVHEAREMIRPRPSKAAIEDAPAGRGYGSPTTTG